MKHTKILVLGNDPFINQIDFSKLDPSIITLGVNRIWLKYIPNYFFFNDIPIATELNDNFKALDQLKNRSFCFSSDWLVSLSIKNNSPIPDWTTVYSRPYDSGLPDSVTTAISIFSRDICNKENITFYIAGVSLKWQEPSHFWKTMQHDSLNKHDKRWYDPRFQATLKNFSRLKSNGIDMISVTPNSMLNKIMRYETIGNLYQ